MRLLAAVPTFALLGLVACDPDGACVRAKNAGSSLDKGSCVVNFSKSLCRAPDDFTAGKGEAALATCRAKGFTVAQGLNGRALTSSEIEEQAKKGETVTLFPPSTL